MTENYFLKKKQTATLQLKSITQKKKNHQRSSTRDLNWQKKAALNLKTH